MTPIVSVIIASHRPFLIKECLNAFTPQVANNIQIEIIVVADYKTDNWAKTIPSIKWIYHPDKSISAKRNKGIIQSKGKYIAFIDDDCKPQNNWINNGINILQSNDNLAGVEGYTTIEIPPTISHGSLKEFKRLESRGFRTNNIIYKKEILLKIGMFDERFTVQREDIDLAFSIIKDGWEIGYCKDMKVTHIFRPNEKWDLLKNCINRRFDPLLYKKHKSMYREKIKTPFTPTIFLLLIFYILLFVTIFMNIKFTITIIFVNLILALTLTARKTKNTKVSIYQLTREFISIILSPIVMIGALIYGSIRFRKFLIF